MNALVTGGGGFIGSALVHELLKCGFRVTSFSRGDYPDLMRKGVVIKRGDLCNSEAVLKACEGIDIIFHVASKAGIWGSYKDFYDTNVTGTANIVYACKTLKIKRLIYTSTASVVFDGNDIEGSNESLPYPSHPLSHYTTTKALAEQYVLKADSISLRTIVLRPHIVIGPGDNHLIPKVIAQAGAGQLRQIGDGKNKVDIAYIDNVISAHICAAQAIENPEVTGKAYFISNGEPVLLWDYINKILLEAGLKPVSKSVSAGTALIVASFSELFHKMFKIKSEPRLTRFLVYELSRSHWFDIHAARRLLNYNPEISNMEGLKRLARSFCLNSSDKD
jgi:2-alkyl-3-oxoalkanoate reductase